MKQKTINCPHCGKLITLVKPRQPRPKVKCTMCGSLRTVRNGFRPTRDGKIQRYLCRSCGSRSSWFMPISNSKNESFTV